MFDFELISSQIERKIPPIIIVATSFAFIAQTSLEPISAVFSHMQIRSYCLIKWEEICQAVPVQHLHLHPTKRNKIMLKNRLISIYCLLHIFAVIKHPPVFLQMLLQVKIFSKHPTWWIFVFYFIQLSNWRMLNFILKTGGWKQRKGKLIKKRRRFQHFKELLYLRFKSIMIWKRERNRFNEVKFEQIS